MTSTIKQSALSSCINGSGSVLRRKSPSPICRSVFLPSLDSQSGQRSKLSVTKPLHISSIQKLEARRQAIRCEAYDADRSEAIEAAEGKSEAAKKAKIGVYFATWWALNVVFNIYNKKVLNAYPYPWLTSTLSLACGSLMMLFSWATGIAETPKTDLEFWKSLFPVSRFLGLID